MDMTPSHSGSFPGHRLPAGGRVLLMIFSAIILCSAYIAPGDDVFVVPTGRVAPEKLPFIESADDGNRHFGHLDDMINDVALKEGKLVLNMQTVAAIAEGNRDLPSDLTPGAIERLRFLIARGVPGEAGKTLADLLLSYHSYDKALSSRSDIEGAAEEVFAVERALQVQYFGEATATQLFGQMNLLRQTLMNRQKPTTAAEDE